jgi:hypothetical protein
MTPEGGDPMRTRLLQRDRDGAAQAAGPLAATLRAESRAVAGRHARRVRRLRIHIAAWALGVTVLTTLWVTNQWRSVGALESFGHEGEAGQWNPTLWALGVGVWSLVVGIMVLHVRLGRPPTDAEVDDEARRMTGRVGATTADAGVRLRARRRLEGVRRVRFHVAAWAFGMIVLTPLWALIEWQDNGGFERFGGDSRPGVWEPWILYVGGIWAAVIALLALRVHLGNRRSPTPTPPGPG